MPFPTLAAAAGIWLFSGWMADFKAAQLVFILFAALVPPLSAALSYNLTKKKNFAWMAGIMAGFTGLYSHFQVGIDAFAIYMVLGSLFFLAFMRMEKGKYLVLGFLAGLMHLSRADGILWLGVAFAAVVIDQLEKERYSWGEVFRKIFTAQFVRGSLLALAGYVPVMGFWYLRNLNLFGSLMPPGNSATLWVLDYDEVFSFPATKLTPARFWASGLWEILKARGHALYLNMQTGFFSMGGILPGILAVMGVWRSRRMKVIWLGWVAWGVLTVMMTLAFPFPGIHGSYFHSGAAFVPLIYALVPVGIDVLTAASLRRFKSWEDQRIRPFYVIVTFVFAVGFTILSYYSGVVGFVDEGETRTTWVWNATLKGYTAVEAYLEDLGVPKDEGIVSATAPAYVLINGRPSYNVPDGGPETLVALGAHYDIRWVLVENSHPEDLDDLFEDPHDVGALKYLDTVEEIHIFIIEDE
jgi:hypothetical protein